MLLIQGGGSSPTCVQWQVSEHPSRRRRHSAFSWHLCVYVCLSRTSTRRVRKATHTSAQRVRAHVREGERPQLPPSNV